VRFGDSSLLIQVILEPKYEIVDECIKFIEEADEQGECTLILSVMGQNRPTTLITAFLMKKFNLTAFRFKWPLLKSLEYMTSRRPSLELRSSFLHQLTNFENSLILEDKEYEIKQKSKWSDLNNKSFISQEEQILNNTYLNAQPTSFPKLPPKIKEASRKVIKFIDETQKNVSLSTVISESTQEQNSKTQSVDIKINFKKQFLKSILKSHQEKAIDISKSVVIKMKDLEHTIDPKRTSLIQLDMERRKEAAHNPKTSNSEHQNILSKSIENDNNSKPSIKTYELQAPKIKGYSQDAKKNIPIPSMIHNNNLNEKSKLQVKDTSATIMEKTNLKESIEDTSQPEETPKLSPQKPNLDQFIHPKVNNYMKENILCNNQDKSLLLASFII